MSAKAGSGSGEHARASAGSAYATVTLRVYVEAGCTTCAHALELMERVREEFPGVIVEAIDVGVSSDQLPQEVFAVPTVLLNDRVISLGTPSWERLVEEIRTTAAAGTNARARE